MVFNMNTNEKIINKMISSDSLLCCGLDPDLSKIPKSILNLNLTDDKKVLFFLKNVVEETIDHVCAYKIQKAFFDLINNGRGALKEIIDYIRDIDPNMPVLLDCKIGDIDNTMNAYLKNVFDYLGSDGVVVNYYMGGDVLSGMKDYPNKSFIVLIKTSNPSSDMVQNILLENGDELWVYLLKMIVNDYNRSQIIPILSSNANFDVSKIREIIPQQMPILLAGVGAQGGSIDIIKGLLNKDKIGVFVNSSRDILYKNISHDWRLDIRRSAIKLKELLNFERN